MEAEIMVVDLRDSDACSTATDSTTGSAASPRPGSSYAGTGTYLRMLPSDIVEYIFDSCGYEGLGIDDLAACGGLSMLAAANSPFAEVVKNRFRKVEVGFRPVGALPCNGQAKLDADLLMANIPLVGAGTGVGAGDASEGNGGAAVAGAGAGGGAHVAAAAGNGAAFVGPGFPALTEKIAAKLNPQVEVQPVIQGTTLVLPETLGWHYVESILGRVGAGGSVESLVLRRLAVVGDPVRYGRLLASCLCPRELGIVCSYTERTEAHEAGLLAVIKGVGHYVTRLSLDFHRTVPSALVRTIAEQCTSLRALTYTGDMLSLERGTFWRQVGQTLRTLDVAAAAMDREDTTFLLHHLQAYCGELRELRLGTKSLGGTHFMELADVYAALGCRLHKCTLNDMAPDLIAKVARACPNLRHAAVHEDDPDLARVRPLAHCKLNLRLAVLPNMRGTARRGVLRNVRKLVLNAQDNALSFHEIGLLATALGGAGGGVLHELILRVQSVEGAYAGPALRSLSCATPMLSTLAISICDSAANIGPPDEKHLALALGVAEAFGAHSALSMVHLANRAARRRRVHPLRGRLEKAYLPLHQRGAKLSIFDGYVGAQSGDERTAQSLLYECYIRTHVLDMANIAMGGAAD